MTVLRLTRLGTASMTPWWHLYKQGVFFQLGVTEYRTIILQSGKVLTCSQALSFYCWTGWGIDMNAQLWRRQGKPYKISTCVRIDWQNMSADVWVTGEPNSPGHSEQVSLIGPKVKMFPGVVSGTPLASISVASPWHFEESPGESQRGLECIPRKQTVLSLSSLCCRYLKILGAKWPAKTNNTAKFNYFNN